MTPPRDLHAPMTLARFTALLDAYGAEPARWPERERAAALTLLARSPEAYAQRDEAAVLDTLLDRAPAPAPPAALAARILAAAPHVAAPRVAAAPRAGAPRRARTPRVAAAAALAAAASLMLWVVREPVAPPTLDPAVVAQLDTWDTPTDALLSEVQIGLDDSLPSFGCDDPTLGCDDASFDRSPAAARGDAREVLA
jgi:hypothetical protein